VAYRRTERVMRRLAARRDAIMAAARALATEQGMDAVQIAPVAARAGIAAGTVYRYFPSKAELVAGLIADRELAALRHPGDAAPGPLSALAAAIVTFAARAVHDRRLAWAVLAEPTDAEIGALRMRYRQALAAEFEARLSAAVAEQHLPEQDAAQAARALTGALLESLVGPLAPEVNDPATARDAVQTLTLFALRGLGLIDARARGLVVQTSWPQLSATSGTPPSST
jgi:AcrR family transcriptional regulator